MPNAASFGCADIAFRSFCFIIDIFYELGIAYYIGSYGLRSWFFTWQSWIRRKIFPISLPFPLFNYCHYLLSSSPCSSLLISSDEPRCLRRMFQMWFTCYWFIRNWNWTTWKGSDIDGNGCIISRYFDRHIQLWDAEAKESTHDGLW
jgi:hypothetical protein